MESLPLCGKNPEKVVEFSGFCSQIGYGFCQFISLLTKPFFVNRPDKPDMPDDLK